MTTSAAPVKEKAPLTQQPVAPPEESVWVRYSPHHELPLSGVSSIAVHVIVLVLLILSAWLAYRFGWNDKDKSLPIEAVTIGGGGGSPDGVGSGPGQKQPGSTEAVEDPHEKDRNPATPQPDKLNPVEASKLTLPEIKDPDVRRLIERGSEAVVSINKLNEDTRARLAKGLRSGEGQGGGGRDGGKDRGTDKGQGDQKGPGKGSGTLTQREKRVLRWVMVFNTANGEDYARQLHALGAILAIPDPREKDHHFVIRNLLQRPAQPQPEELSEIKRIYWVDSKPDSVDRLAKALQLRQFPGHFVAFFPESLEEKLLKMELDRARGKTEDDIAETKFEIRRSGTSYQPVLVDQKYLR